MGVNTLVLGFEWYIVFLFSTVCHEAAHALAALKLGDRTAYLGGQVSLDPVPHIRREPIGMVLLPIISFFGNQGQWMMGWASAPFDLFWARRYPKRAALMALAGPVSNCLLMLVSGMLIRLGVSAGVFSAPSQIENATVTIAAEPGMWAGVAVVVSIVFSLNLALFVFNLLPLPPLDGSALPPLVLSRPTALRYQDFLWSPQFRIIGIFAAMAIFYTLYPYIHLLAINVLYFPSHSYGHH